MDEFDYLGAKITSKCEDEKAVQVRLTKANKYAESLRHLLTSNQLSRKVKFSLPKTGIRPITIYACETLDLK